MIHTGLTATYPRLQQPTGDSFSHPCPVCGELPLGKKGMSVLNEPQLSAQPCRHSTGWPCSGPQALPLISPHGTGIESSETRDNTAQIQSVGSTNTTICQTFDDQSKDFTTAMRAESGKKKKKPNKPPSGLVFCADILPSCFTDDISVFSFCLRETNVQSSVK